MFALNESPRGKLAKLVSLCFRVLTLPFRRWRWLLAGLVLLIVTYVAADQILWRQLLAQREMLRARGGKVTFEDVQSAEVSTARNADVLYQHASMMIAGETKCDHLEDRYLKETVYSCGGSEEKNEEPMTDSEREQFGERLERLGPAFDLIREADTLDEFRLPTYLDPVSTLRFRGFSIPDYFHLSSVARYIESKALWDYRHGRIDEAFEWIRIGMHMADAVMSDACLISALRRTGYVGMFVHVLQNVLYEGDVAEPMPAGFSEELAVLRDRSAFARVYEMERCAASETYAVMNENSLGLFRPLFTVCEIKGNGFFQELIDGVQQESFEKRRACVAELEKELGSLTRLHLWVWLYFPIQLHLVTSFDRFVAEVDLCDIAIKLKRFKRQQGAYPDSLAALGTKLPQDPFGGQAYKYRREGEGFIVYSIGPNGTDDGGVPLKTSKEPGDWLRNPPKQDGDIIWCCRR